MVSFRTEVLFFAAAWCLAAVCALLVTFRDRSYRDLWDLLATAALAGFVAVAVLGALSGTRGNFSDSEPYYLSLAVAIGLLGETALKIPHKLLTNVLKRFTSGLPNEEPTTRPGEQDSD